MTEKSNAGNCAAEDRETEAVLCRLAKEQEAYAVALRRELHEHPELSFQEEWTCGRICRELEDVGIPYEIAGEKNVIACLQLGEGRKLAVRADFDALPVQEEMDVPWKSKKPGVMHACGHDAHTAILLGLARAMKKETALFSGTVYFCFQQAEEVGGGAEACVAYLKKKGGVDGCVSLHVAPRQKCGTVNVQMGPRCAGSEMFFIDIEGRGGHGSRPDRVVDPIRTACEIYRMITDIPVYSHNPFDTCIVSPCVLQGGTQCNVFPDKAHIEGTIRFFKIGDGEMVLERIREISESTAKLYGARAIVTGRSAAKYPVINDAASVELAEICAGAVGWELAEQEPNASSDNFADFQQAFGGCYCNVGSYSERDGAVCELHNARFDLDESCIGKSVEFLLQYAWRFLKQGCVQAGTE